MRNDNAQQVEIDDRTKRAGEVRQEFAKMSVTTDQVDHTEQRLDARLVARAVNAAYDACWRHGIT